MKICYIGGHWATNIGNAFYNLGGLWLLNQVANDAVYFMPDPPQEYSLKVKGNYDLVSMVDADLYIITGPSWSRSLVDVYKNTFDAIKKAGRQIAFLSVGAAAYTTEEAQVVADFLACYPVKFAFTRDKATYDLYSKRVNFPMVDGICTSMFLNDALQVPQVNDDYTVYNFRPFHEPKITLSGAEVTVQSRNCISHKSKELNGSKIIRAATIPFMSNVPKLSSFSLFDMQKHLYRFYDYASDLPYGYLSLYKSAKIVFSDRVHTCAATLALGGKAMYIKTNSASRDGRSSLFTRLKLDDIYERPICLDVPYIEEEKRKMQKNLTTHLS